MSDLIGQRSTFNIFPRLTQSYILYYISKKLKIKSLLISSECEILGRNVFIIVLFYKYSVFYVAYDNFMVTWLNKRLLSIKDGIFMRKIRFSGARRETLP